jgi:hypothetical protein
MSYEGFLEKTLEVVLPTIDYKNAATKRSAI